MSKIVRGMREQVYDIIKERIFSQEYDLGQDLNIVALSKELSISNTPIREAISMLCSKGLVISNYNSKFRVVELTEQMMNELNGAIYMILTGAYIACCREEKEDMLLQLLEDAFAKQTETYHAKDQIEYIKSAIAFDKCFVEVSGNQRMIALFDELSDVLFLSVRYAYQHSRMGMADNLKEHKELLQAAKRKNHKKMDALLYKHYDKHFSTE